MTDHHTGYGHSADFLCCSVRSLVPDRLRPRISHMYVGLHCGFESNSLVEAVVRAEHRGFVVTDAQENT